MRPLLICSVGKICPGPSSEYFDTRFDQVFFRISAGCSSLLSVPGFPRDFTERDGLPVDVSVSESGDKSLLLLS